MMSLRFVISLGFAFLLLAPLGQQLVEEAGRLRSALLDALLWLEVDVIVRDVLGRNSLSFLRLRSLVNCYFRKNVIVNISKIFTTYIVSLATKQINVVRIAQRNLRKEKNKSVLLLIE